MRLNSTTENIPGVEQELTREEAKKLVAEGTATAIFLLMQLSAEIQRLKKGNTHAPPSATPVYRKATTKSGRRRKTERGAKPGHAGSRRSTQPRISKRTSVATKPSNYQDLKRYSCPGT